MAQPKAFSSPAPTADQFLRRRRFSIRGEGDMLRLLRQVRMERLVGKVEFHFSEGTSSFATVEERVSLPVDQPVSIDTPALT